MIFAHSSVLEIVLGFAALVESDDIFTNIVCKHAVGATTTVVGALPCFAASCNCYGDT